jgi:hypothetical protein
MTVALRICLVVALIGAGWSIYRQMPDARRAADADASELTALRVVLEPRALEVAEVSDKTMRVQLLPVDVVMLQREFYSEPRPGVRFEDFLAHRLKGQSPIEAQLDQSGQAIVKLRPGKWWVHATLAGAQNLEWRVPINVFGRQQTIELTPENAYARTRKF